MMRLFLLETNVINHYCFLCYYVISTVRMRFVFGYSDKENSPWVRENSCINWDMATGTGLED